MPSRYETIALYPETKDQFEQYKKEEFGTHRIPADEVVKHLLETAQA